MTVGGGGLENQFMDQMLHELRRTAMLSDGGGESDGHLLERYIAHRDQVAFEALVRRHGAMVLGVCRRVTGHAHDADDAFQAVFLVLARKAAAVNPRALLGNWLYGVACRSALEARSKAVRRRSREQPFDDMPDPNSCHTGDREACAVLDQELEKLPEKYRSALVLCELEGRSRKEVAHRLGIPAGTLSSRLAYARKLLAKKLTRRGIVLPAAGLAALAADTDASAGLVATTVTTCINFAAGPASGAGVSASVLTLVEGVMKTMLLAKLKRATAMMAAALCVAGAGVWCALAAAGSQDGPPLVGAKAQVPANPPPRQLPRQGRLMVFRNGGLATMNPDGKDQRWLLEKDDKVLLHPFTNGSLSPDGKRLALLVIDPDSLKVENAGNVAQKAIAHVHVRNTNDKGAGKNLELTGLICLWSGNSDKLMVIDINDEPRAFEAKAWIVDVKTAKKTTLDLPKNHLVTDWSRDGQWLLANVVEDAKSRLVMLKIDGSARYDVTMPGGPAVGKLSPRGDKVLYLADQPGKKTEKELLVQSLPKKNDAEPIRISPLNHEVLGFTWSPDGSRIAYSCTLHQDPDRKADSDESVESFVIIVNADGTNMVTVQSEKNRAGANVSLGSLEWR